MEAANSDNPPNSLAFVNLQDHSNIIESDDNEDQNWNNSNITSQTGILGCTFRIYFLCFFPCIVYLNY